MFPAASAARAGRICSSSPGGVIDCLAPSALGETDGVFTPADRPAGRAHGQATRQLSSEELEFLRIELKPRGLVTGQKVFRVGW